MNYTVIAGIRQHVESRAGSDKHSGRLTSYSRD